MIKILLTLNLFLYNNFLFGQTCTYSELSKVFDFGVTLKRLKDLEDNDSSIITLTITNRAIEKRSQTINLTSTYLFDSAFSDCNASRSYSTKKNIDKEVLDNDYGDLIVADLNFDTREDIAIKKDSGGNGGPFYDFYIQDLFGLFIRDPFLSEKMVFFPSKINKNNRTLITYSHAGVCGLGESIYLLTKKSSYWKEKSHKVINICKE